MPSRTVWLTPEACGGEAGGRAGEAVVLARGQRTGETPTTPLVLRLHLLERLCQLTFAPLCLEGQSGHVLSTAALYRLLLLPAE